MNKLTLEVAMRYPNAKVKFDNKNFSINRYCVDSDNTSLGLIKRIDSDYIDIFVNVSDCKLILRKFDSLTEDEKNKLSYEAGGEPMMVDFYYKLYPSEVIAVDYLRSINIDLDSLIDKGIAIEERN